MEEEQKQQEIRDACLGLLGDKLNELEKEGLLADNEEKESLNYVKKST